MTINPFDELDSEGVMKKLDLMRFDEETQTWVTIDDAWWEKNKVEAQAQEVGRSPFFDTKIDGSWMAAISPVWTWGTSSGAGAPPSPAATPAKAGGGEYLRATHSEQGDPLSFSEEQLKLWAKNYLIGNQLSHTEWRTESDVLQRVNDYLFCIKEQLLRADEVETGLQELLAAKLILGR